VETDNRYDERQTVLAPYLERLTTPEQGPPPLHPAIGLDPWEQSALQEALDPNTGNGAPWPALLAESVAFLSKYLSETDEMERGECTSILSGNMGEAKRRTGFRNKLARTVKAVKDRISPEDYQDAEAMHRAMLAPAGDNGQTAAAAVPLPDADQSEAHQPPPRANKEPDEGPPKPIKMNRYANLKLGHAAEDETNYAKYLLLVLGATLLVWSVLILPRIFKDPLPVLTMPDLPLSTAIEALDARPPSLYVVVDKQNWNAMPSEQRLQWVEAVGQTAAAAGYTGVNFRTSDGASVAQWLKRKGSQLLTSSESGS